MQAVILAAGKSTRTYPLTLTRPKPLLKVANKTIIEHNLEQLSGLVDEVIIVVGYKSEMIKDFLNDKFGKIKIKHQLAKLDTFQFQQFFLKHYQVTRVFLFQIIFFFLP